MRFISKPDMGFFMYKVSTQSDVFNDIGRRKTSSCVSNVTGLVWQTIIACGCLLKLAG